MAKSSVQTPPKRKASLRVSDAPVVDERFQRADKAKGQDVSISRSIHGDLVLLHRVALDPESSTEVRQSLLQTAQATARFRDPHVLPVREVRLEGDSLVFVQDYPQGPLLSDAMTPGRPMPLVEALTWMRQFAHSLEEAESQGLTLSQIGPADFVVTELLLGAGKRQLISLCPPVPAGWWLEVEDPVYASPEQKVGDVCDIRSSLFSAGAVLAVMLTGHRPERDNDWLPLLAKAALPKLVDQALKRVLNPDPAKRCANPAEWMALLDKAIAASAPTSLPQPVRLASPPALVADPPPVAKQKAKPEPVPEAPPAKQKASPPPAPAAEAPPAKSQAKQVPAPPSTPAKQKAQAKPLPLETQTRVIATRSVPQVPLNVLSRSTFVLRDGPPKARPWGAVTVIVAAVAVLMWVLLPSGGPPATDTIKTQGAVAAPKTTSEATKPPGALSTAATRPVPAESAMRPSAPPANAPSSLAVVPPAKAPIPATPITASPQTQAATPVPSAPSPAAPSTALVPAPIVPPVTQKLSDVATGKAAAKTAAAAPPATGTPPVPPVPATIPEAKASVAPTPDKPAEMARKTTTELSPPPSVASNPSPVAETKPSPPAKADLLKQASAATRTERPEIYRKVLAEDAHNPEALRGLVRASLADMPPNGERLDELKQWANELVALNEPLGTHALGCIAFQQASETDDDLTAVTRRLAEAVVLLKRSLAAKQTESYFFLVQAYINLHNVRVQNKAGPEAERTRRALLNDIANAPPEVPAKDSRSLAVRLEGLLKERASTGKPHPHAAFLRPVIRSLYTKAAEKGDDVSKTWLKSVAKQ